jgi:hypothetical protein
VSSIEENPPAAVAEHAGRLASGPSAPPSDARASFVPADWGLGPRARGIRGHSAPMMGARVPAPVRDQWNKLVEEIAEVTGLSKGDVAAAGLIVAMCAPGPWMTVARAIRDGVSTPMPQD